MSDAEVMILLSEPPIQPHQNHVLEERAQINDGSLKMHSLEKLNKMSENSHTVVFIGSEVHHVEAQGSQERGTPVPRSHSHLLHPGCISEPPVSLLNFHGVSF